MTQFVFCSRSSGVAYPITCIYVNHLVDGSQSDKKFSIADVQRLATGWKFSFIKPLSVLSQKLNTERLDKDLCVY